MIKRIVWIQWMMLVGGSCICLEASAQNPPVPTYTCSIFDFVQGKGKSPATANVSCKITSPVECSSYWGYMPHGEYNTVAYMPQIKDKSGHCTIPVKSPVFLNASFGGISDLLGGSLVPASCKPTDSTCTFNAKLKSPIPGVSECPRLEFKIYDENSTIPNLLVNSTCKESGFSGYPFHY